MPSEPTALTDPASATHNFLSMSCRGDVLDMS